jgi:hypothetical protein
MTNRSDLQAISQTINSPRIPHDIDAIVETIARLELRKKNAVVSLAVAEYVASHHPELIDVKKAVTT